MFRLVRAVRCADTQGAAFLGNCEGKLRFYRDHIVTKTGRGFKSGVPLGENFEPRAFTNLGQMSDLRRLVVSLTDEPATR